MVQFPIDWTLSLARGIMCGGYISELKLNNEWKIVCLWEEDEFNKFLKPHSIEFKRVSTTDEVSISGTLYPMVRPYFMVTMVCPQMPPALKFSKFMESGSSSIVIYLKYTTHVPLDTIYYLRGVVNITSVSTLGNEECRKCVQLKPLEELSNDLGRLLDPETCCLADVNLKCGDASIPAHKNILSARSPVFAAMFKNPTKENRENEVVISDIDVSVLRIMLAYVYTGKPSILTVSSASDLLHAADKYQLGDLKRVCCDFLKDNISLQNVLRIIFLGDLHCNDLKSCAINYICNTCTEFSVLEETEEWETMRKERPDLAVDILVSVVKAKEKKI